MWWVTWVTYDSCDDSTYSIACRSLMITSSTLCKHCVQNFLLWAHTSKSYPALTLVSICLTQCCSVHWYARGRWWLSLWIHTLHSRLSLCISAWGTGLSLWIYDWGRVCRWGRELSLQDYIESVCSYWRLCHNVTWSLISLGYWDIVLLKNRSVGRAFSQESFYIPGIYD